MELPVTRTLALDFEHHVFTVTLNRPQQANAMNPEMWKEVQSTFEWADAEPGVRVIVLAGAGKHFCAGIDLSMFSEITFQHDDPSRANELFFHHVRGLQRNLQALRDCRKPVLAAMHGACVGAAIDMTCYADMRYAAASARFCVKEIDIGIVADVGTLQNLPKLIPEGVVRELALTGRYMDAREAQSVGFINKVFDDEQALRAGVYELARIIASKTPLATRGTKQVLNHARDHSLDDGLEYVALWNAAMMSQHDVREAMAAKLEQRDPVFKD